MFNVSLRPSVSYSYFTRLGLAQVSTGPVKIVSHSLSTNGSQYTELTSLTIAFQHISHCLSVHIYLYILIQYL